MLLLLVQVLGCGLVWLRTSSILKPSNELQLMSRHWMLDYVHHSCTPAGMSLQHSPATPCALSYQGPTLSQTPDASCHLPAEA